MAPRLSGKELADKRRIKQEEKKRNMKKEELKTIEKEMRLIWIDDTKDKLDHINAFHTSLYIEIDKLNKKAPKEQISNFTLKKVNEHISNVKSLLPDDLYLSRIHQFEPAGDNPEYRDVAVALAEIGAAISQFKVKLLDEEKSLTKSNETSKWDFRL